MITFVDSKRAWGLDCQFWVNGTPAPQGSKRGFVRGGKVSLVEVSKRVKPWRDAVHAVAAFVNGSRPPLDGPLLMEVTFHMPAPKKWTRPFPSVRPDLSKLVRSTEDALVTSGMIADDSRIIVTLAEKVYAADDLPGAFISLYRLETRDESA